MIGSLKGNIVKIYLDQVLVEVNGVGYSVFLPSRVLAGMNEGDPIFVFVHTQVKEDDITLFGFLSEDDKKIFTELLRVNGVGAKTAVAVLGLMNAREIVDAITLADQAQFTQVSGIGPKAAVRIINELKDRVAKLSLGGAAVSFGVESKVQVLSSNIGSEDGVLLKDALSALENLGYQRTHILELVKEIVKEEKDISNVISLSLKRLAG